MADCITAICTPDEERRDKGMKKPTFRRLGLGFVQHIMAAVVTLLVVVIVTSIHLRIVTTYEGTRSYTISPFDKSARFEDSEIFGSMFRSAINDITTLVVTRGQMETEGEFDSSKEIDCTAFINRKGKVNSLDVTAVYRLEDLIKWNKSGVEMSQRSMSKEDFVTYFDGHILDRGNFYLDGYNQLRFKGFDQNEPDVYYKKADNTVDAEEFYVDTVDGYEIQSRENFDMVIMESEEQEQLFDQLYNMYSLAGGSRLIDEVYDYLEHELGDRITLDANETGEEVVYYNMLQCKYVTVDGDGQLTGLVNNWIDYFALEDVVVGAIEEVGYNFEQYQMRMVAYDEGRTNFQYVVRIGKGKDRRVYTNLSSEFNTDKEELINNYFSKMDKHLIYTQNDMTQVGNVEIGDDALFLMLNKYEYVYTGDTQIWVGLDTDYPISSDQFTAGRDAYNKIVPHSWKFTAAILLFTAVWIVIWNYLSFTAGRAVDENGGMVLYLNWFDRLYTEFVLLLGAGLAYIGLWGLSVFWDIQHSFYYETGYAISGSYSYYYYAYAMIFGFMASLTFCAMWYSLMRRIKGKNLWRNSFLHFCFNKLRQGCSMVIYHRSTAVRTLLPYNIFLFVNLSGVFAIYVFRYHSILLVLVALGLLAFDALVGVVLFRQNAENAEIVEGITKIRQGEVNYQLDVQKLHGENRKMAEAVNNIGEGIRNAVETSMKDERMKTDLITNVSHDIKTPLTSIINYVDLLKREKIDSETARGYIGILEAKAQRLKQLTDDLVEVSRISSGNINLFYEKLNLTELVNQTIGEFSEKFEEKNLQAVLSAPEEPAYIYADSRRMWRVMENLFNNICKYAMPSTRVYLDMQSANSLTELSIKNISEQQLNISPEELTERFIRGDVSRTTEGSGLGLSITQNLVEVQGGSFKIYLDGDLFKAVIRFPEYVPVERIEMEEENNYKEEDAVEGQQMIEETGNVSQNVLQYAADEILPAESGKADE